jgi:hypothetical protein
MLRFVDGIQVDERGNSRPGAVRFTELEVQAALARDAEEQRLVSVAAAAERRMVGRVSAGRLDYCESDFQEWANARHLTPGQKMEIKRLVTDLGYTLEQAARRLRI